MPRIIDLSQVLISQSVAREWDQQCQRFIRQLSNPIDPSLIPNEQGRIKDDGDLEIFVTLPNGQEFSMLVNRRNWRWAS